MHRRHLTLSEADRRRATGMDDLFDPAARHAAKTADNEFWSVKIVRQKTGLSRASIYKYVDLGLFPRQRQIGPGRIVWRV